LREEWEIRGYALLGRLGVRVSAISFTAGSGTKTILVLSKRDTTPVVADFARFQSDRE